MQLLLTNPPRRRRKKVSRPATKVRRKRCRTVRRATAVQKGALQMKAKRKTRRRRRSATTLVKARRRGGRRSGFARSGFIDRDLLMNVGGVTAGLFLPNLLLAKLASSTNPTLAKLADPNGWGSVAAKAGIGLAAAYFLKRYQPKMAVMFGVGACSGAALQAVSIVQANRAASQMAGYELSSGQPGVAGYIASSEQPALAGYIGGNEYGTGY